MPRHSRSCGFWRRVSIDCLLFRCCCKGRCDELTGLRRRRGKVRREVEERESARTMTYRRLHLSEDGGVGGLLSPTVAYRV